jgi:hypothetical protein
MEKRKIAVDFDATVVFNDYPYMGGDVPSAVDVLAKLVEAGHELILLTMRADNLLDDAEAWFQANDIPIKYSGCNPEFETGSRKVYAHLYIDDHGACVPLIHNPEEHKKPYVDWEKLEVWLKENGWL